MNPLMGKGRRRKRGGWRLASVFVCTLSLSATLGLAPRIVPAASAFCDAELVRDYLKPLESLPPIPGPPTSGDLPFGPVGLSLNAKNHDPLTIGKSVVGFKLAFKSRSGRPSPYLGWTVIARLLRVGSGEHSRRLIERKQAHLGKLGQGRRRDFSFHIAGAPALYRLEFELRDIHGIRLGHYGEYFRIVRPTLDAQLSLNGIFFRPGEAVDACLENFGTEPLSYGLGYSIEVFDGATWSRSPIDPPRAIPFLLLRTGAGEAASHWSFLIPANAPSGWYRFAWTGTASRQGDFRPGRGQPVVLTPEFQIAAG